MFDLERFKEGDRNVSTDVLTVLLEHLGHKATVEESY
jgi:hypothetical protein